MKTLTTARNFLDTVNRINTGGCGISALAMYLCEKKKNNKEASERFMLCFESGERDEYETNLRIMNNEEEGVPHVPFHIFYKKNGKYYDSECIRTKWRLEEVYDNLLECSLDYLIEIVAKGTNWNYKFDRGVEVPRIEKELQVDLSFITINS